MNLHGIAPLDPRDFWDHNTEYYYPAFKTAGARCSTECALPEPDNPNGWGWDAYSHYECFSRRFGIGTFHCECRECDATELVHYVDENVLPPADLDEYGIPLEVDYVCDRCRSGHHASEFIA